MTADLEDENLGHHGPKARDRETATVFVAQEDDGSRWISEKDYRALEAERDGLRTKDTKHERELGELVDKVEELENGLAQAFYLITGRSPEWSNVFSVAEALEEIDDAQTALREAAKQAAAPAEAWRPTREEVASLIEAHILLICSDGNADPRRISGPLATAILALRPSDEDPWRPIETAPRDGTHIILAFGQGHVCEGWWDDDDNNNEPRPWGFLDTEDFSEEIITFAPDGEYGPSHWQPMPYREPRNRPESSSDSPLPAPPSTRPKEEG